MSGDNFLQTLLMGAMVVGTGGSAIGAIAPTAFGGAAATATAAATPGFFAANSGIFSALSGIAGAGMQFLQGEAAADAAEIERQQILERNEQEKVDYAIENAEREKRLSDILSTQTAVFGSRGIAAGSGVAIRAAEVSNSEGNKGAAISDLNQKVSSRQLMTSASQKRLEGRSARISGSINAGKSLFNSFKEGSFDAVT